MAWPYKVNEETKMSKMAMELKLKGKRLARRLRTWQMWGHVEK
jgi:hypothetical protein